MPQLGFPPVQVERLTVHGFLSLPGEHIGTVAVNQVSQRMTLGFGGLEVSSLDNGGFGNLNPLASVRELGESSREGRGALSPNLDAIDLLAVLAWTLNDGSHVRVSLG